MCSVFGIIWSISTAISRSSTLDPYKIEYKIELTWLNLRVELVNLGFVLSFVFCCCDVRCRCPSRASQCMSGCVSRFKSRAAYWAPSIAGWCWATRWSTRSKSCLLAALCLSLAEQGSHGERYACAFDWTYSTRRELFVSTRTCSSLRSHTPAPCTRMRNCELFRLLVIT